MVARTLAAATVAIAIGAAAPGLAASPSGEAQAVVPAAAASGTGGSRVLEVKGPVFMGDVIKTDAAGLAQIRFIDDTKMVIGPNSQITIDSFVFKGPSSARDFSLNAVRGTFRFITGASAKQAYSIKTPTATIGVRGTEFDFTVNPDGTTNLALYGGEVRLCDTSQPRRCTVLSGTCSVIILTPLKDFKRVNGVYERTAMMDTVFPYAFRQRLLLTDYRVDSGSCEVRDFTTPTSEHSDPPPDAPPAVSPGSGGSGDIG